MNSTQATAAASGGVSAAALVVANFVFSKFGVAIPADVSAAAMVLLAPVVHFLAVRFGSQVSK